MFFWRRSSTGSFINRWIKINSALSLEDLELVAVTCWAMWSDMNKLVHGDVIPPASIKSKLIRNYIESLKKTNSRDPNHASNCICDLRLRIPTSWSPPLEGFWKLDSYAACLHSPSSTGMGMICRNKEGGIMIASSRFYDFSHGSS